MIPLVLITSVIHTPKKELSYINTRSIYNSNERFIQTQNTFKTVREKIPHSKIFLIECSPLLPEEEEYLQKNSDYYLNLFDNETVKQNIYSISKSLGEGTMTLCAMEYILSQNIQFDHLIKISGRYWLSNEFHYENFINSSIVIKHIDNNSENVFTGLYKIPKELILPLKEFLQQNQDKMFNCIGYEILFGLFINSKTTEKYEKKIINPIGLEGHVSVSNDFYKG
jgi:hypothetical protein